MSKTITDAMVEAGAKALREHAKTGSRLCLWEALPNARKHKWRAYARVVLDAAGDSLGAEELRAPGSGK